MTTTRRKAELTFKENLKHGRHGWLRLTPAYSVRLVDQVLAEHPEASHVLDPFSGTGTTGLVCAERGIDCDLLDINPFLIWLAKAKVAPYSDGDRSDAVTALYDVIERVKATEASWEPPIANIDRWWSKGRRGLLSRIVTAINDVFAYRSHKAKDLLLVAFCRCLINWSNAAFNHQSMSFRDDHQTDIFSEDEEWFLLEEFEQTARAVISSSASEIRSHVNVIHADSRSVPKPERPYDAVVTSPPYPNRMSYIRELRPYMYWLGYLVEAREAGELDWKAIGGTWGVATSRVAQWDSEDDAVPFEGFGKIIDGIAQHSQLLAKYVHKYFADINKHICSLKNAVVSGGQVFYIVGNSKFYDTLVPVEHIYAAIFEANGFKNATVSVVRKRNSKKELFEYLVSAERE